MLALQRALSNSDTRMQKVIEVTTRPSDRMDAVRRLRQEIHRFSEEQANALKSVTYLGMTPHEAKEYEERRSRIINLIHELELLDKAL